MRYYPIHLDVAQKACLVVGGGSVGARKVHTLLECGANVTVVSLKIDAELKSLVEKQAIAFVQRTYQSSDLEGKFLVISATDNEELNNQISQEARVKNSICNIVDRPKACSFILPAIVKQGDLLITVSTSGKSPAFAKKMRQLLEQEYGPEYGIFLNLMGIIRNHLLAIQHAPEEHKSIFEQLINSDLIGHIQQNDRDRIQDVLVELIGNYVDVRAIISEAGLRPIIKEP
jgi:precorrin-2 dehydrogenase/sirohydrochlorin ferrochelatase